VNRVIRTGVVEVGISHFSTSERKEFAAVIGFSFNFVSVELAPSCCICQDGMVIAERDPTKQRWLPLQFFQGTSNSVRKLALVSTGVSTLFQ
jgi:hypothetical protein